MKFMLIAKADKDSESGAMPSMELMTALDKSMEELTKAGKLIETGGLLPSSQGARVRLSGGRVTVTDGPFAEAKELIAGYAIVQVDSKEEAIELAKRFYEIHAEVLGPSYEAEGEVRQLFDPADFGGE